MLTTMWAVALLSTGTALPPQDKERKEKKVCIMPTSPLGSRIPPKPVCRTKAEWAEANRANSFAADDLEQERQNRGMAPDAGGFPAGPGAP